MHVRAFFKTYCEEDGFLATFLLSLVLVAGVSFCFKYLDTALSKKSNQSPILLTTIAFAQTASKDAPSLRAQKLISSEDSLTLGPDEKREFKIGYKNTGTAAWKGNTKQTLTLHSTAKRESFFYDASWQSGNRIASPSGDVLPGHVAYVSFTLHAPKKSGDYTEKIYLSYNDQIIQGSSVSIRIRVTEKKTQRPVVQSNVAIVAAPKPSGTSFVSALKLIQSDTALTMPQNGVAPFTIGFKNTGLQNWEPGAEPKMTLRSLVKRESYFHDRSWTSGNVVMPLKSKGASGEIVYFNFVLNAPLRAGNFTERLALFSGDKQVAGTEVSLPIVVTKSRSTATLASAPASVPAPATVQQTKGALESSMGSTPLVVASSTPAITATAPFVPQGIIDDAQEKEPSLRIGVFHSKDPIQITAQRDYDIRDSTGTLIASQQSGSVTTVIYSTSTLQYTILAPGITATSMLPVRFIPSAVQLARGKITAAVEAPTTTPTSTTSGIPIDMPLVTSTPKALAGPATENDAVFTILSYSNRPGWSTSLNDNAYRALLEVRYTQATDRVWVINELNLEQYLKGIAETSNNSPYEYQKALIVAARTYALYHIKRQTKYLSESFTMRATDADQVYRGYNAEVRLPNVSRAVNETKGVVVTYNKDLAITPYYSQSDGRTRSWEEVWAGSPKPWLIGKPDPCCSGLKMLGHGVGMSARGALLMALEGKGFEEILKYYYTGIELRRRY